MLNDLRLGARLLLRDWHAGELKILLLALVISVTSMGSIGLFIQRIEAAMLDQTGQFLGANLILESPRQISDEIKQQAQRDQLDSSNVISFSSVIVANDQFQLSHIKAVDEHYPLLSEIRISEQLYGEEVARSHGPAKGEVWLVPRLFNLLGIELGEQVEIGRHKLTVSAVLKYDPGQAFSFMSIAPKLLMHIDDIEATGIIQPGSRIKYLLALSGDEAQHKTFTQWLEPRLEQSQKLLGGTEGSEAVNSAMQKSKQYLSLAAMLSVMLSGIAIAMAANHYGERHYNQSALMRCIGAQQKNIVRIFSAQIVIIGLIGCLIGIVLGYITQLGIVALLAELISSDLPAVSAWPLFSGFLSGMITLAGFSLPAILRLKSTPPLKVLRDDLAPLSLSLWLVYGLAIGSIIAVMWWQSGNLQLTLMVLLGTLVCVLALYVISSLLFRGCKTLIPLLKGPWKVGLQQLLRHRQRNQLQLLALGLSMMVLMLIFLIRNDLIIRWQQQLPEQAPNHFIINIQSDEVAGIKSFLAEKNVSTEGLFPMVRGRIEKINAVPINETVEDNTRLDNALRRELNLSWNEQMQDNNQLVEGQWWNQQQFGKPYISIEDGLAKRLGVGIGDSITFKIVDEEISASILNIRSVQWDSFQPNFYVIFSPDVINDYPVTYISSFYLPKAEKQTLNDLVRAYPTVTVLEIDDIMNQVKAIMQQVSTTIGYVMLFVLFAGLVVLAAALQSTIDQRMHAATIMRTLGASKAFLARTQLSEFIILGYLSGLLAVIATETVAYGLYTRVFQLDFELHLSLWLYGPLLSSALIYGISRFYMRRVTRLSPARILREA